MFIKKYLVLALIVILASCGDKQSKVEENTKKNNPKESGISLNAEQAKLAGIELGTLEKRSMYDVVECVGVIDVPPTERASVSAPIEGIVRDVKVIPGTKVRKGEVIATLEHQNIIELQEKFLKSKSQFTFTKQELERKQGLFDSEAGAKKLVENAKNNFELAKAQFQSLKKQLELIGISEASIEKNGISSSIAIVSPINGFISTVQINLGMYVNANFTMFSILNDKHKHLELEVFSSDIDKVEQGQKIAFSILGSQKKFDAEVHLINKEVHKNTRTINIHGHIETEYPQLIVGTQVMANILTNKTDVFALSQSAVIRADNQHFVFVKKGDKYKKQLVKIGKQQGGYFEILNFRDFEGQKLVSKGAYYLASEEE